MTVEIIHKLLHFKQPAGTSRGVYTTRNVWYIVLTDPQDPAHYGVGECAPLPALSCDDVPEYEDVLNETCRRLEENVKANLENAFANMESLRDYPSILFGMETALAISRSVTSYAAGMPKPPAALARMNAGPSSMILISASGMIPPLFIQSM